MISFTTESTTYLIDLSGHDLGTYVVHRVPREDGPPSNVGESFLENITRVTVHPASEGLTLTEARRVVFWEGGKAILVTGRADQRAYLRGFDELPYDAIPLGMRYPTKAELNGRPALRPPAKRHLTPVR